MKTLKVPGKNRKHRVLLYTLSTCGWCKLTKKFCKDHDVEYEFIDVDLSNDEEREEVRKDILKRGGRLSYPAIIIDDKILINGFHEEKIKEALDI